MQIDEGSEMDANPGTRFPQKIEDVQMPAMNWARQTIALTISVRAAESGQPLTYQQIDDLASGEAQTAAQELWRAALEECGQRFEPGLVATMFARRVLDWTVRYRS